jgi:hypothetical protein
MYNHSIGVTLIEIIFYFTYSHCKIQNIILYDIGRVCCIERYTYNTVAAVSLSTGSAPLAFLP